MGVRRWAAIVLPVVLLGLPGPAAADPDPTPPPADVDWDYQLGGDRPVPVHVGIVERDRRSSPVEGAYGICYVNAYQAQPDERRFWRGSPRRWALVLKDHGKPVVDSAWGEWLLDTRTAEKRQRLAEIVGRWIDGCAADGYDAVELDNLDSFSRSHGLLSPGDARRYARLLIGRAHDAGLAVAQKNWVELADRGPRLGFDFAVAEECGRWRECAGYVAAYGDRVLVVEYRKRDFRWTCEHFGAQLSVVRRDLELSPTGVRHWC